MGIGIGKTQTLPVRVQLKRRNKAGSCKRPKRTGGKSAQEAKAGKQKKRATILAKKCKTRIVAEEEKRGEKSVVNEKLMLCKGGVQRAFFPIYGITHSVNNLNYIATALSDTGTAFRLTAHLVNPLLHLQLDMLPGQRAIVLFFNHGLCIRTHFAAPFRYHFFGTSRHTCISTVSI